MITLKRLETLLASFPGLTVGLLGDLFLDRYLEIEPDSGEMSIETGLEAYQITKVRNSPGALGTVMNNLTAIGVGRLIPVTVIGDDGHGYDLVRQLSELPVDSSHILRGKDRLTPTYTKPLKQEADGSWRELNRFDVRTQAPLSDSVCAELCRRLDKVFQSCDGLMVLDQINEENWGVVGPQVRDYLAQLSRQQPDKLIFVDSRTQLQHFRCGVLKGNQAEILAAAGQKESDDRAVLKAAQTLHTRTGKTVYCTRGEQGSLIVQASGEIASAAAYPATGPVDIVGAGDSTSSGIVASLLAGADEIEAAEVGNLIASITVQQLGVTGTASPEQIKDRCRETA